MSLTWAKIVFFLSYNCFAVDFLATSSSFSSIFAFLNKPYYIFVAPDTTFFTVTSSTSGLVVIGLEDYYCCCY